VQRSEGGNGIHQYTTKRSSTGKKRRPCEGPISGLRASEFKAYARTNRRSWFELARATLFILKKAQALRIGKSSRSRGAASRSISRGVASACLSEAIRRLPR
jgi:hypothetical protein